MTTKSRTSMFMNVSPLTYTLKMEPWNGSETEKSRDIRLGYI